MKLRIFNTHLPPYAFTGINREGGVFAQEAKAQLAPAGVGLLARRRMPIVSVVAVVTI